MIGNYGPPGTRTFTVSATFPSGATATNTYSLQVYNTGDARCQGTTTTCTNTNCEAANTVECQCGTG
ncbi:MAG: hypothetical protein ACP5E4_03480, partial [Candidatus Aenigmatarchaeota archaeon]